MKKIFLIAPVRGNTPEETEVYGDIAYHIEEDASVYWPERDTEQWDHTGLRICQDNLEAMRQADEVHVIWDGKSQGCLFDLGMAFALGKKIIPVIGRFPRMSKGKSFQNMVYALQEMQENEQ